LANISIFGKDMNTSVPLTFLVFGTCHEKIINQSVVIHEMLVI